MQYLPSHPYAGSLEDPYDEVRFGKILDEEGALGVYLMPDDFKLLTDSLKIDPAKLDPQPFKFSYSAPYGKVKERPLFFVVIPPRNTLNADVSAEPASANPDDAPAN